MRTGVLLPSSKLRKMLKYELKIPSTLKEMLINEAEKSN